MGDGTARQIQQLTLRMLGCCLFCQLLLTAVSDGVEPSDAQLKLRSPRRIRNVPVIKGCYTFKGMSGMPVERFLNYITTIILTGTRHSFNSESFGCLVLKTDYTITRYVCNCRIKLKRILSILIPKFPRVP